MSMDSFIERLLEDLHEPMQNLQRIQGHEQFKPFKLPPDKQTQEHWIERLILQHDYADFRFTAILLGEANSGKSTVLNALFGLSKPFRLPINYSITTVKPTRLSYKHGEQVAACLLTNNRWLDQPWLQALRVVDLAQDAKYAHDVREVRLLLEHPLLGDADIVDMPGSGTTELLEYTIDTLDYLDLVDIVIWVIGLDTSPRGVEYAEAAIDRGLPVVIVFNAWGALNADDTITSKEMEAHENLKKDLYQKYQDIFGRRFPEFTIWGKKCLQAQEEGKEIPTAYGLAAFQIAFPAFVKEQRQLRSANERKLAMVAAIVQRASSELVNSKRSWQSKRNQVPEEKEAIERKYQLLREKLQVTDIAGTVRRKIQPMAERFADSLLNDVEQRIARFIDDTIKPLNMSLLRYVTNRDGLDKELRQKLNDEYLQLQEANNWLEKKGEAFYLECWDVVEAEWRKLFDRTSVQRSYNPSWFDEEIRTPVEDIAASTSQALNTFIITILGVAVGVGVVAITPGPNLLMVPVGLAGAPFIYVAFRHYKNQAKETVHTNLHNQQEKILTTLMIVIMNRLYPLFYNDVDQQMTDELCRLSEQEEALGQGLKEIDQLMQVLQKARR